MGSLDDTRFVTYSRINGVLFAGDAAFAEFRAEAEATMTDENSSINNALTNLTDRMNQDYAVQRGHRADVRGVLKPRRRCVQLHGRPFEMDAERYPNRVIVSTESYPGRSTPTGGPNRLSRLDGWTPQL